ncbi:MAG: hypothetical protein WCC11_08210 [Gammaproteobacteria bacterium]
MLEPDSAPQSPARVWSRGVMLGWASFRRLFVLATLLGFISLLPTLYLAKNIGDAEITPDAVLQLLKQGHFILNLILLEALVLVLSSLVNALIIRRLDNQAHGTAAAHEFKSALYKLPALLLAGILCGITLAIGLVIASLVGAILGAVLGTILGHGAAIAATQACVIAAAVFIVVNLLFFQFAIVLDGKGPVSALNLSCALVFRNWWRTFLVLLICVAAIVVIIVAVMLPFVHWLPLLQSVDTGRTLLVKGVLKLVGAAIFSPFVAGVLYVLYRDLKMRHARKPVVSGAVQA